MISSGICGEEDGDAVLFIVMYGLLFLLDDARTIIGRFVMRRLAAMLKVPSCQMLGFDVEREDSEIAGQVFDSIAIVWESNVSKY